MKRLTIALACLAAMAAAGLLPSQAPVGRSARAVALPTATAKVPVLAYYYIWFDTSSWRRAKVDFPQAGRYSSDDAAVMRGQVRLAKKAGINGFLVSWKHTPTLDRRLAQLVGIAEEEDFNLGIVYQGLDFNRRPLPVDRVATDLDYFAATFSSRAAFRIFAKPLVIWSGTWEFSVDDVARVTADRRASLSILASEKNVAGYARLSTLVDGDAYYWSSVNPLTYKGYLEKLAELGRTVHASGGLWIAPAAGSFDARLIGGNTVVPRRNGATLRIEIDTALASSPDALGLISWNEYSENSHIEPSVRFGYQALNVIGERLGHGAVRPGANGTGGRPPAANQAKSGATSSVAAAPDRSGLPGPLVLLALVALFGVFVVVVARRGRRGGQLRVVGPDLTRRTRHDILAERRRRVRSRRAGPPGPN
jgi:hypothetical protein